MKINGPPQRLIFEPNNTHAGADLVNNEPLQSYKRIVEEKSNDGVSPNDTSKEINKQRNQVGFLGSIIDIRAYSINPLEKMLNNGYMSKPDYRGESLDKINLFKYSNYKL